MVTYYGYKLYAPVAQSVEHLTFNQGVRDSSSRRSTRGLRNQSLIFRDVAQLVARVLWEHDVAGSNPVIPTKKAQMPLRCLCFFA